MTPTYLPLLHPLESIANLRDLGGRPAFQDRPIKRGLLFRSAELSHSTPEDLRYLEQLGIRRVVDFRDLDERENRPDQLPQGVEYCHLPALPLNWAKADVPERDRLSQLFKEDLLRFFLTFYRILAASEETAAVFREFFNLLLKEPVQPILWHCTQGKDRTGIAAILLQTALGVSWEGCLEDYFLTNQMIRPQLEARLAGESDPQRVERLWQLNLVRQEGIQGWLEQLTGKWGGIQDYLRKGLGLGKDQIRLLRDRYLE